MPRAAPARRASPAPRAWSTGPGIPSAARACRPGTRRTGCPASPRSPGPDRLLRSPGIPAPRTAAWPNRGPVQARTLSDAAYREEYTNDRSKTIRDPEALAVRQTALFRRLLFVDGTHTSPGLGWPDTADEGQEPRVGILVGRARGGRALAIPDHDDS